MNCFSPFRDCLHLTHLRASQNAIKDSSLSLDDERPAYILKQATFHSQYLSESLDVVEVVDLMWDTIMEWGELLLMWIESGVRPDLWDLVLFGHFICSRDAVSRDDNKCGYPVSDEELKEARHGEDSESSAWKYKRVTLVSRSCWSKIWGHLIPAECMVNV
jgi:hypothetical protein